MVGEPVAHFLGGAGGEVVGDRDHLLAGRDLRLELVEEADQVEAVARLRGHRDHLAAVDVQRGEQALGAVALVLVLAPARLPRPCLPSGRVGALAWMPVFSSIETTSSSLGRIEVQAADLRGLRLELGAELAHHPVLGQVRLDLGRAQDLVRLRPRHPDLLAQLAIRPALRRSPVRCFAPDACRPARSAAPAPAGRARAAARPRRIAQAQRARPPRNGDATSSPSAPSSRPRSRSSPPSAPRLPPARSAPARPPAAQRSRTHDPLQLAPILDADPDPFRRCSHPDRLHRRPQDDDLFDRKPLDPATRNELTGATTRRT